jgi:hypothetical protein
MTLVALCVLLVCVLVPAASKNGPGTHTVIFKVAYASNQGTTNIKKMLTEKIFQKALFRSLGQFRLNQMQ